MNIKIEDLRTREDISEGESYGWDIGIDFGRPGLAFSVTMRDLIHWSAYRLDTGSEDYIINHRAAVVLRRIAEDFYPHNEDEADYVIEELQDAGCTDDFEFEEPHCPAVDIRLLGLHDGFICVDSRIDETRPGHEDLSPALVSTFKNTVDFPFPAVAVQRYGVAGLRLRVLDLIQWLRADAQLNIMSFEDENSWLDALEVAYSESRKIAETEFSRRMRIRHGDNWEELLLAPGKSDSSPKADPDMILRELADLVGAT